MRTPSTLALAIRRSGLLIVLAGITGLAVAACAPSSPCGSGVPGCDGSVMLSCSTTAGAVAKHEVIKQDCGPKDACMSADGHVACVDPTMARCDPLNGETRCRAGGREVQKCDAALRLWAKHAACAEGEACKIDDSGAYCGPI